MGKDFVNGLKLGAKNTNTNCSFIIEGIGLGADEKIILDKAQKLTIQDDVNIITGLLGHVGLNQLQEYVKNMEVVLLYSDLGATIPKKTEQNPWVFCNSFELYMSAMLFGKHASKLKYKNIALSSSYYDSGYGLTSAIEKTLCETGGKFAGHFITPLHPREKESLLMSEFIHEVSPDAVFAFHSGIYAQEHSVYLKESKIMAKVPFFSTAFGADKQIIKGNESSFTGLKCISPWQLEEKRKANKEFIQKYKDQYDKIPSYFAMLGYENGLIIKNILEKNKHNSLTNHKVKEIIPNISIEGPRGNLFFSSKINRTSFPQYIWELEEGTYIKKEKLDSQLELTKSVLEEETVQNHGWDNAYLCN